MMVGARRTVLPLAALLLIGLGALAAAVATTVASLGRSIYATQQSEATYVVCSEMARLMLAWNSGPGLAQAVRDRDRRPPFEGLRYKLWRDLPPDGVATLLPGARIRRTLQCRDVMPDVQGRRLGFTFASVDAPDGPYLAARIEDPWTDIQDGVVRRHRRVVEMTYAMRARQLGSQGRVLLAGGISLAGLMAAGGLAWWLNRRIRLGVAQVNEAFGKLEGGDWSARAPALDGIAELRVLADHANAALDRIQAQMRALERAGGRIAHDLLDPLGLLKMRVGRTQLPPAQIKEFEDKIDAVIGASRGLLDIVAAQAPRPPEPVDLSLTVAELTREFEPAAAEAGMKFQCDLQGGVVIMSRPEGLRTILANWLGNATRHGTPGPITVQLSAEADRFQLIVRNGVGTQNGEAAGGSTARYRIGGGTVEDVARALGFSARVRIADTEALASLTGPRVQI